MDRPSNNRMYILFTESHKILVNSIYLFQTYERRWNGGIKNILGAGSNFRRVKLRKYFWKKNYVTYTYGALFKIGPTST